MAQIISLGYKEPWLLYTSHGFIKIKRDKNKFSIVTFKLTNFSFYEQIIDFIVVWVYHNLISQTFQLLHFHS
jgi:hypothetical protein